jgi:transposase
LIPSEHSSGSKRRLGSISKQGNVFLRTMLVEAAQSACRYDEEFRREYQHRCHQKPKGVAKVAAARKLAVRLYWMLRNQMPYTPAVHNEGSPSHPVAD